MCESQHQLCRVDSSGRSMSLVPVGMKPAGWRSRATVWRAGLSFQRNGHRKELVQPQLALSQAQAHNGIRTARSRFLPPKSSGRRFPRSLFVYLSHFTVVSHQLNQAMRSLFGNQGAEVSLSVEAETNHRSFSQDRTGGEAVPQHRISHKCAG